MVGPVSDAEGGVLLAIFVSLITSCNLQFFQKYIVYCMWCSSRCSSTIKCAEPRGPYQLSATLDRQLALFFFNSAFALLWYDFTRFHGRVAMVDCNQPLCVSVECLAIFPWSTWGSFLYSSGLPGEIS